MNEETKHIESCRAEDPLAQTMEACGNESNLQAALQPLLVETMPGYVPVATTAPTSPIAELPGVLISIIRRVATKPLTILGDRPAKQSLLGTLLDTWNAIRNRLSGNPSLGIPDRRADMTSHSLPTALALLSDRKITNGGSTTDGIPDGMSLARLLCDTSAANSVTEIVDDNYGWTMKNNGLTSLLAMLPAVTKAEIWCEYADESILADRATIKHLIMPYIKRCGKYNDVYTQYNIAYNCADLETIDAPELEEWYPAYDGGFGANCPKLTYINAKKLRTVRARAWFYARTPHALYMATALKKLIIGTPTGYFDLFSSTKSMEGCDNLIHLEICGDGGLCEMSFNINQWSPTNALDASRTDLIEQGSTAANNLQQFLLNFREFIALRLANLTGQSKLTLTLSAGVFSAVFTNESGSTEEIVARNAIRDEIRGEITDRNWKVTDSTNNFNN